MFQYGNHSSYWASWLKDIGTEGLEFDCRPGHIEYGVVNVSPPFLRSSKLCCQALSRGDAAA